MEQDKIGRKDIVEKICGLVDSLQKNKNFCLALNGAWGSGKSFVMEMIEERLKEHKEYFIVKYDAWENTFYSDPLIAILSCVIDKIQEKLSEIDGFQTALKAAGKEALDQYLKANSCAGTLAKIIKSIASIIKKFNNPFSKDTSKDSIAEFKSYQVLLKEVKVSLEKITIYEEYVGKQNKLIVLVDEIDRCLPDEQLKVLERLHHLFDVKNCAVIVAMNQSCVAKTVQKIYGIDGYEYLRKFFNFTFKLEMSADEYLKNLFESYIMSFEKFQGTTEGAATPVKLAYQCLLYGSETALNRADNRELTRYFEAVMNVCNDFGWQRLNQQYVFFILIALYIRKIISPTFLNEEIIKTNQEEIDKMLSHLDYPEAEMPYYDYLNEYLGVDRRTLSPEIKQLYRYTDCNIPQFSWCFNEIVAYSTGRECQNNEMRRFQGKPILIAENCRELRRLIILYGGEQARDETNEK